MHFISGEVTPGLSNTETRIKRIKYLQNVVNYCPLNATKIA